jgi:hypothetical protein
MTHTPPIPAGNQSPYPLHEPPHVKTPDAPGAHDPRVARTPDHAPSGTLIGIAAGVGLAAIAGGLFWALRSEPRKKRKKRKAPKQAA